MYYVLMTFMWVVLVISLVFGLVSDKTLTVFDFICTDIYICIIVLIIAVRQLSLIKKILEKLFFLLEHK